MNNKQPDIQGLLVVPHVHVQNANAISSPMTWGFPSITAFTGLMWALERKLGSRCVLNFESVGVVCHQFDAQVTSEGYTRSFHLTRNPVNRDGGSAAIVEDGRAHLDVTLVFGINGDAVSASDEDRARTAQLVADTLAGMRIAGGSVIPAMTGNTAYSPRPYLLSLDQDSAERSKQMRRLRRRLLPGFSLVSRDDVLELHLAELREINPEASALDAWLDLCRLKHRAEQIERKNRSGEMITTVEWRAERQAGWLVPIPVGYGALSPLYPAGQVVNTRDNSTPFRFVESLYSIGQWVSPHRMNDVRDMLWYKHYDSNSGLYRCHNDFSSSMLRSQN